MNFNLQKVSTHLSDSIIEMQRMEWPDTGELQTGERKKERNAHSPPLGPLTRYPSPGGDGGKGAWELELP